jgi:Ni2+-binding GTPase involved in maturation of urease and hydrogenase
VKLLTFSGPPSSGKTSVIIKLVDHLKQHHRIGAIKFDCLTSHDATSYEGAGIPVQTGLSGALCPDHFFASNIGACLEWGRRQGLSLLISESAGLCNRCSPHLRGVTAVCVIDTLSGIDAPQKIGPMLKLADIVVITKGDLISQAEREVFALSTVRSNPRAKILFANGLTGQGLFMLAREIESSLDKQTDEAKQLRFSMPGAVCSYCFGETKIGETYATGNIKYMKFSDRIEATGK